MMMYEYGTRDMDTSMTCGAQGGKGVHIGLCLYSRWGSDVAELDQGIACNKGSAHVPYEILYVYILHQFIRHICSKTKFSLIL